MPKNLQRLSACMSAILAFLECPVCLDTIPPPTYQCDNGHLMCMRCRAKSERCPVCRLRLARGRSLISDQVYNAFTQAFNLKEDPEEKRAVKLQQIFKIRSKNKNVPDIKITQHTQTNRFLTRIMGKSSSDDNLASGSAKEFPPKSSFLNSDLRAKSLSSNEINCTVSPVLSRASSMQRLKAHGNYLDVDKSASLNVSSESLDQDGDVVYRCPYNPSCLQMINGSDVIEHFKTAHEGPLIQYFKPIITLPLSSIKTFDENSCCVIYYDSSVFFMKTHKTSNLDLLFWIWCLGDEKKAAKYECLVSVTDSKTRDVLLGVASSVFSLSNVTWTEIKSKRRGVFLNSHVIKALTTGVIENEISFSVAITKKD